MSNIPIKRVYEKKEKQDGFRILVDRLWPRGLSKEEAQVDLWLKEIAPSAELRKWFNHDIQRWDDFRKKYTTVLKQSEHMEQLQALLKEHKTITLVYGAKDPDHNQAVVIKEALEAIVRK